MRILLLANSWYGLKVSEFLKKRKEKVIGVALHAKDRRKSTSEILKILKLPRSHIFDGTRLNDPEYQKKIKALKPDLVILCGWAYILKQSFLSIPTKGVINMHPGFLPYNRGMNPNVWPIVEQTPAGATLHYVTPGVDDGSIIAREEIPIDPTDTGGSLYNKTLYILINLLKKNWNSIKQGSITPFEQEHEQKTFHYAKDLEKIDKVDLDKMYRARDLINIIRARTYEDRTYSYFEDKGERVYLSIHLSRDYHRSFSGEINLEKGYRAYNREIERKEAEVKKFKSQVLKKISKIKSHTPPLKIPIYDDTKNMIGALRAITDKSLKNKKDISNLMEWRDKNQKWFPTQVKITYEGTKKWMKEQLLDKEDRILFMIEDTNNTPFGHMGFYRFDYDNFSCAVDNIIRGRDNILPGGMTYALQTLTSWAFSYLKLKKLFLNVFENNERAIKLYQRCGFKDYTKIPLHKHTQNGVTMWEELESNSKKRIDRYYRRMVLFP